MRILNFNPAESNFNNMLSLCVDQLANGKLVAMATETVYGLAGDATNGEAVARVFEVKQRPQFNPLIAHVSDMGMAQEIGVFDEISNRLAQKFWPGPLTLVVPKNGRSKVHDLVCAGLDTIAIRCPGSQARRLIEAYGLPLAAPSANRSGRISPTSALHVGEEFPGEDIIVLDGGDCEVGIESTIAQVNNNKIIILRAGSVTREELARVGGVEVVAHDSNAKISAPGMMVSHYAPRSKVILECSWPMQGAAMLGFGDVGMDTDMNLSKTGNLREAASNLYRHLRALDALGLDNICVTPIPQSGLGIAINDRLARAAAPRTGKKGEQ